MIAICERTSIEITLENATNYAVYALLRLFSIIDTITNKHASASIHYQLIYNFGTRLK